MNIKNKYIEGDEGLFNIEFDEYLKIDALNSSKLKDFIFDPALCKWYADKNKYSSAFAVGNQFEQLLLEPDKFDANHVIMPMHEFVNDKGKKTTKNSKIWKDFVNLHRPKTCLLNDEVADLLSWRDNVLLQDRVDLISGRAQVSAFWYIDVDGENIYCKARADMLGDNFITDLKTVSVSDGATVRGFHRAVRKYRYDIQAAWYILGFSKFLPIEKFYFLFVEKSEIAKNQRPACQFFVIADLIKALSQIDESLPKYLICKNLDVWPSEQYVDGIITICLDEKSW